MKCYVIPALFLPDYSIISILRRPLAPGRPTLIHTKRKVLVNFVFPLYDDVTTHNVIVLAFWYHQYTTTLLKLYPNSNATSIVSWEHLLVLSTQERHQTRLMGWWEETVDPQLVLQVMKTSGLGKRLVVQCLYTLWRKAQLSMLSLLQSSFLKGTTTNRVHDMRGHDAKLVPIINQ